MNKSIGVVYSDRKWVREPSNCTRIVVVAAGVDAEHIDLMHHGFSCFANIAFLHVDRQPVESGVAGDFSLRPANRTNTSLFEGAISECAFYIVVNGTLDEWLLHDLPLHDTSINQLSADTCSERSIIEAVEQIKSLARASHAPRIEFETPDFARPPSDNLQATSLNLTQ
ncbi:hypothetical protein M1M11_02490 [Pseudomonas azerbaijanoccidens]|uniref:hypothetical protein n=1 Tax=Pseudomonas azerbaijanoccidentalis TaxID=2842347 RepID=UPI002009F92F|nr:hypothetical protein [Pseudomonas azerbaijanoccidentalis]MCK8663746.1 hypothetical protein [Pseudomonas azerbaijanoccidentalis]